MEKLALIFDLDGTLIDSAPDIHGCLVQVLRAEGLPEVTFAQTRSFIGRGVGPLIARTRDALGLPENEHQVARMAERFQGLYTSAVTLTELYPNVRETLGHLAAAGHTLALCTNKPKDPTHAVLDHFGLAQMFHAFSYGDGPYPRKPDPAPVHHIMDTLGPMNAAYIGDSETDAATARNAGLPFFMYTEGYRKISVDQIAPDASFSDFADLPQLLTAL